MSPEYPEMVLFSDQFLEWQDAMGHCISMGWKTIRATSLLRVHGQMVCIQVMLS